MSNVLTLLISPVIVGVVILVIEYWIIQPIRNRQSYTSHSTIKTTNTMPNRNLSWLIYGSLIITGILSLSTTILILFGILSIHIRNIDIESSNNSPVSESNITLATIIYSCFIFSWISSRFSKLLFMISLSFISAISFGLWLITYFPSTSPVIPIIIIGWIIGIIMEFQANDDIDIFDTHHLTITLFLVFPANALYLIHYCNFSPWLGWLISIAGTLAILFVALLVAVIVKSIRGNLL